MQTPLPHQYVNCRILKGEQGVKRGYSGTSGYDQLFLYRTYERSSGVRNDAVVGKSTRTEIKI